MFIFLWFELWLQSEAKWHITSGSFIEERRARLNDIATEMENLKVELSVVKKQNEDLAQHNQVLDNKFDETTKTFKMIASYFGQVLKEVRKGNVSSDLLDGAESAILMVSSIPYTFSFLFSFICFFINLLCSSSLPANHYLT